MLKKKKAPEYLTASAALWGGGGGVWLGEVGLCGGDFEGLSRWQFSPKYLPQIMVFRMSINRVDYTKWPF